MVGFSLRSACSDLVPDANPGIGLKRARKSSTLPVCPGTVRPVGYPNTSRRSRAAVSKFLAWANCCSTAAMLSRRPVAGSAAAVGLIGVSRTVVGVGDDQPGN